MTKWESSNCRACGVKITYRKTVPRQFCSLACCNSLRVKNPDLYDFSNCPTCGKRIEHLKTWPRKYCSNLCAGKGLVSNFGNFKPADLQRIKCENCQAEFEFNPTQTNGRFCSQSCFGQWQSANNRGARHWAYGKKFPDRPKNLIEIICPGCDQPFKVKSSHAKRRACCSKACQAAHYSQSGRYSGANSPVWRGGYLPYYGPSWRLAKRAVRNRDGVCRKCGKTPKENGKALDVHHIIPFREFGPDRHLEANALSNLVALCHSCHAQEPK